MKINLKKIQESINHDAKVIYEGLNTTEAKKLYNTVIGLYEEISSFEKEAPSAAINALSPHLRHVQEMLEKMLTEPMNYISREDVEESGFEDLENPDSEDEELVSDKEEEI